MGNAGERVGQQLKDGAKVTMECLAHLGDTPPEKDGPQAGMPSGKKKSEGKRKDLVRASSQFSNVTTYLKVVGKLSDSYFNVSLFSNPGDQVLKGKKQTMDQSVPYFQQESGACPLEWRTTIH